MVYLDLKTVSSGRGWLTLFRSCIVEFIGDLLFVFIGSLSATGAGNAGTLTPAFAHGFTIMLLVASMGHISGGHYNPAVSLGVFISGNLGIFSLFFYVFSQLLGGFVGALLVRAIIPDDMAYGSIVGGMTLPNTTIFYGWPQFLLAEIVTTFILVTAVLNAAVDKNGNNPLAALAIGGSVFVDVISLGNVSGASMNPARSFGPSLAYRIFFTGMPMSVTPGTAFAYQWVYYVGPGIGATIAALIYKWKTTGNWGSGEVLRLALAESESRWIGRRRHRSRVEPAGLEEEERPSSVHLRGVSRKSSYGATY